MTLLAITVGFIPAIIALLRSHAQRDAINWLNVGTITLFVFGAVFAATALWIVLFIYAAVTGR